jgi:hypothetical protein
MAWILIVLLALTNVIVLLLYYRESREVKKLSKIPGENVKELQNLVSDLQHVGGGMLKLERINPDHVYLHSPL